MSRDESPNPPSIEDWLLAQTDREDSIGIVAQRAAANRAAFSATGFERWVAEDPEGRTSNADIESVRSQYRQFVAEMNSSGHSSTFPQWVLRSATDEMMADSFARHSKTREVSPGIHLLRLHRELHAQLRPLRILYLDTCHWIKLRDAALGNPKADPRYGEILQKLRQLKASNQIICPASFPILQELMKQTRYQTRRAMAELIDELSDGICLQEPDSIEDIELKRQMLKTLLGSTASDMTEWMWTKAMWVMGEVLPSETSFTEDQEELIQKVFTDIAWNSRLADVAESRFDVESPDYLKS